MKTTTTRKFFFLQTLTVFFFFSFLLNKNVKGQAPQITFSEVNYQSDTTREAGDWVELHNFGTVSADISGWIFTDSQFFHFFMVPPGTIINAGDYLVLSQDTNKFLSRHPLITNYVGPFVFGLNGKSELIRLFDNLNNLYLSMIYADTLPWPKGANGKGRTLELKDPLLSLDNPDSWFDGCMGGSPGTAYSPCTESVIFSEINYNADSIGNAGDWVEIRNISLQPVDVSGWIFRDKNDSDSFVIPPNTIMAAGANLVLAGDFKKFKAEYNITNAIGPFNFNLSSFGEVLRLYNNLNILYLSVVYNNKAPWPSGGDGDGYTLELTDSSANLNDGSNWHNGCLRGSPGGYSSCEPANVYVNDIPDRGFYTTAYPNPFTTTVFIEINSVNEIEKGKIDLSIYDIMGRNVETSFHTGFIETSHSENLKLAISKKDATAGIYFYQINYENKKIGTGKLLIGN